MLNQVASPESYYIETRCGQALQARGLRWTWALLGVPVVYLVAQYNGLRKARRTGAE